MLLKFVRSSSREAFGAESLTISFRVLYAKATEVKGRRPGSWDRHGLDAFHAAKRRRMARAISCWRAAHPASAEQLLRIKLALVPLLPTRGTIGWIDVDRLC